MDGSVRFRTLSGSDRTVQKGMQYTINQAFYKGNGSFFINGRIAVFFGISGTGTAFFNSII
jgi:hypothetical protein